MEANGAWVHKMIKWKTFHGYKQIVLRCGGNCGFFYKVKVNWVCSTALIWGSGSHANILAESPQGIANGATWLQAACHEKYGIYIEIGI